MFIRRLPPLNALRSFESAARLGSFNRAAEELFVTPSAVSHQIKSLEEFLGLKLFQREKRQVQITVAGEKYLVAVSHALDELDAATRRLISAPNTSSLTFEAPPAFLSRWLMPKIKDFQALYPDVELRLSTGAVNKIDFDHSDLDMAVYFGDEPGDDNMEVHLVHRSVVVPVCSPRKMEEDKIESLSDLRKQPLIHVTSRRNEWQRLLHKSGVSMTGGEKGLSFSSTQLALGAALEGLGIALSDKSLISRELQYGQLVVPVDVELLTGKAFYLVYPKDRQITYGMRVFREWLLEVMGLNKAAE
ncbi:LysR family transcriptional regulator, glycine cleavage system transcriptional activator [Amphritea japonica ATCC BAA-1530]|uniref:LysR family transcriptional regulator, glycine cleavage system transcriptional activator n=1 Tax=Amphritea japonica ATCC BAA-1530 TaxID=1278309 RepID=A0A7R6PAS5_9GAMM|nr:LysR family transcriptional regulator, glycine cleavage system transcriptional activator [Amphritea japonica ATCC BAA-1530]